MTQNATLIRAASLSAEDRLDIQQLLSEYSFHEDTGAAEEWAALFTRNGTFQGGGDKAPITGRAALAEFARRRWEEKPEVRSRAHWVCNIIIEPTETGAHVSSYQMNVDKIEAGYVVSGVSGKSDEVCREDGRWRFEKRTVVPVGSR